MATNNIEKQSFGQAGATLLTEADTVNREICAILFLEDSVLHATNTVWPELDESYATRKLLGNTPSTVTIPNGVTIVGQFSRVGLDSGAALCYHAA
tara:strand:+ start:151 stop:438 length:288 start_codon:yes stop_codon:yes gene_type:complete